MNKRQQMSEQLGQLNSQSVKMHAIYGCIYSHYYLTINEMAT